MSESAASPLARRTRGALFLAMARLTLSGVGGLLPFAERILVHDLGWLEREEFVRLLAVCQALPGPNLINLAAVVGLQSFGWTGVLVALAGLLGPSLLILAVLASHASTWLAHPASRGALHGMALVTAGLVLGMGLRYLPRLRGAASGAAFALAAFGGVGLLHWPLPYVMLALVPLAVGLARRRQARSE